MSRLPGIKQLVQWIAVGQMTKIQFPAGAEIFLFSITLSRPVMGSHHAFQPMGIVEGDASL